MWSDKTVIYFQRKLEIFQYQGAKKLLETHRGLGKWRDKTEQSLTLVLFSSLCDIICVFWFHVISPPHSFWNVSGTFPGTFSCTHSSCDTMPPGSWSFSNESFSRFFVMMVSKATWTKFNSMQMRSKWICWWPIEDRDGEVFHFLPLLKQYFCFWFHIFVPARCSRTSPELFQELRNLTLHSQQHRQNEAQIHSLSVRNGDFSDSRLLEKWVWPKQRQWFLPFCFSTWHENTFNL